MKTLHFVCCYFLATISLFAQDLPFSIPFRVEGVSSYRNDIPKPQDVLKYTIGERYSTPSEVLQYVEAVDRASDRVVVKEYGRTYENRPLVHAYISTPENLAKLEQIRQQNVRLVHEPNRVSDAEIEQMPAIWYAGYSVHGNEASGTDASLLFLYHLAAAQGTNFEEMLKKVVIILDPCFNPDGRDRFTNWANRMRGAVPTSDGQDMEHNEPWPGGRTNHYWFDLNRDWVVTENPESLGRVAVYYQYRPQLLTDHHEMGSESSFFFQPGIPSSNNMNTPQATVDLHLALAKYHEEGLNKIGSLYYSQENFDDFYYGKGSTFPDINGSMGILFEQAASRALLRETTDGVMHYAFTVRNQFVTSLTSMKGITEMRTRFLKNMRDFYKSQAQFVAESPVKGYLLDVKTAPNRAEKLLSMLKRHEIHSYTLKRNIGNFAADQYVALPLSQTQARLLEALFEKTLTFKDSLFYDISTWTMPIAYGVNYVEMNDLPMDALSKDSITNFNFLTKQALETQNVYAYLMEWGDFEAPKALYELIRAGLFPRVATAPFELEGKKYERGTIVIPTAQRNMNSTLTPQQVGEIVQRFTEKVRVTAVKTGFTAIGVDLGSNSVNVLQLPRIALIAGSGTNSNDVGEIWHLLSTKMKMPISLVDANSLNGANLSRYNTIILADGNYSAAHAEKLKTFISDGGVLITMMGATTWAIQNNLVANEKLKETKVLNLSKVAYADLSRTRGAQGLAGAIFEANLDTTHPIAYGLPKKFPLFKSSETLYLPSPTAGATVGTYSANPLISGYVSDEMLGELKNTAAIIARNAGRGKVIMFADNLNFRSFWYSTNSLLMNAIFFGKSF